MRLHEPDSRGAARSDCGGPRIRAARFAGGCLLGLAVSWNIANTGAVAPTLAEHYDAGLGAVGALASTPFLAEVAIMLPGGRAIDSWGMRSVSLLALAFVGVGSALLLAPGSIALAIVWRFIVGLGVGLGFVAGAVYVQQAAGGRAVAAQGVYGGVSLSGGGLALAIVPHLDGWLGWRAPYASAVAVAVAAALILIALPTGSARRARRPEPPSPRSLLSDRRFAILGAVHASSFGFSVVLGNWVVTLLQRTTGASAETAGAIAALTMLVGIAGRPLGGAIARGRRGPSLAVMAGAAVLGTAASAVLALGPDEPVAALAAAAVGLAGGLPFGLTISGAAHVRPEAPGAAVGALNIYAVSSVVIGAPLLGLAFSLPGDGRIGFAAVAVLWLASLLVIPRAAALASDRRR